MYMQSASLLPPIKNCGIAATEMVGGFSAFHISTENIWFLIVTFKPLAGEIKKAKQNSVSPSLVREYSITQQLPQSSSSSSSLSFQLLGFLLRGTVTTTNAVADPAE